MQIESDELTAPPSKRQKVGKSKEKSMKTNAGKCKRVRVYPNPVQRSLLQQWFGTARWTYNQCLTKIKEDKENLKKKVLRSLVVNNDCHNGKSTDWALKTPYEVRDGAMIDVVNAYASNFAKMKKNKSHHFRLRYRSRKDPQEAIYIRGRSYKDGVFYSSFFGKDRLKAAETLPDKVDYDCKLVRNRLGHYHLCIPMPLAVKSDNQAHRVQGRIAALDPGVRTFHTIYDTAGYVIEAGKNDFQRIKRLCYHLDDLVSRTTSLKKTSSSKRRYNMRKASQRLRLRIRNLVDECHKKLVKFLLSEYELILLPSFETQKMVQHTFKGKKRVISSDSVRSMLTWSHYRFKQRLLFKRQEYPWCKILIVDEAFTTKTCGQCGQLNHEIKGKKTFVCDACGTTMNRDANAARNILLKNSSLIGLTPSETLGLTPSLSFESAWVFSQNNSKWIV